MKKFFLNKKLMTFVLSFSLVIVIGGIAVFAAFQSGLPGVERIKETFMGAATENPQDTVSKPEEPVPEDENSGDLNSDIVISPEECLPEIENTVDSPIVFDFPE